MSDAKPDAIRPIGGTIEATEFETAAQRAAAEAIVEQWPRTHNFREIARRTSWSPAHIRKVFNRYFESADEHAARDGEDADLAAVRQDLQRIETKLDVLLQAVDVDIPTDDDART